MTKPKFSHEDRMRVWSAERLLGPAAWILSRGIFVGCFIFTLRITAETIFPVPDTEHVSNYKIISTLVIWIPCGLAIAFFKWRAKEHEYAADVAKQASETEPKAPVPTTTAVTPAAAHLSRQP